MRTNIDIDDELMARAMQAGPYKTKREAVEAGLKLLARQAAYREILKWRGKLKWEGDESVDWTQSPPNSASESETSPAAESAGARVGLLSVEEPAPAPYTLAEAGAAVPVASDVASSSPRPRKPRARR
jgi:Arc/MetJ family transcription regulator